MTEGMLNCPLCDGIMTPRTEIVKIDKGMVTLRYAECDACGSEITGNEDGEANKLAVLDFRTSIDCLPATGIGGLVCAQITCEPPSTTAGNLL